MMYILCLLLVSSCSGLLPEFLEEPNSEVVPPGSSVILPCKVSPPSAKVEWKYNGDTLQFKNNRRFSLNGTNLLIKKFKHRRKSDKKAQYHEGIYQCIVKTKEGSVASRPIILSKPVLKPFQQRDDVRLNVSVGLNVILPCQPPVSNPEAVIEFQVNGSKAVISGKSERFQIFAGGSLMIRNASFSDSGQYRCIAVNPVTLHNRTANHVVHLKVTPSSSAKTQQATIITSTKSIKAGQGDKAVFECAAVGSPTPNITWERYGGLLSMDDRHTIVNGNLHISNLTQADVGTYLCTASNGIGESQRTAMMLDLVEIPTVEAETSHVSVNPGESVKLACRVKGHPVPEVMWYHNAVPFTNTIQNMVGVTTQSISDIQVEDAGIYQCMSSNELGVAYAVIQVEVKGQSSLTSDNRDAEGNILSGGAISGGVINSSSSGYVKKKKNRRRKGRKRGKGKKKRRRKKKNKGRPRQNRPPNDESTLKLVPPTAPNVVQLSDTSVKLNWTVPENDGLPITFFRIQYKAIKPKKGPWMTVDKDIRGDQRMYEVIHLKQEGTYKFRIAAVYSNNDNKAGPNSKKFSLKTAPYSEPQPPEGKPVIVEVRAVEFRNIHGLNVKWSYTPKRKSPIEGFSLHFKVFNAKTNFTTQQLLEPNIRSYMIQDLAAGTAYKIKLQCFNTAGYSAYSNEVVERTKGGKTFVPPGAHLPNSRNDHQNPTPSSPNTRPQEPEKTSTQSSSEMLYMILGIVLGVMMLFLIIFIFMCWWKQRQQQQRLMMMDAMNGAVHSKFQDSSQRIYADSLRKKYTNSSYVCNGSIPNGHGGNAYTRMNISVNPLSDIDVQGINHRSGSSSTYQTSTFVPNGSVPSHYDGSDNNFNKINRSMDGSVHSTSQLSHPCIESPDSMGGGEAPACPPSPHSCNVPTGFNSDFNSDSQQEKFSGGGCNQQAGMSLLHPQNGDYGTRYSCESSLGSDTGANSKPKRRRKRTASRDHGTRDQATNTDLSSNEGTIEFSSHERTQSSSPLSGQNSSQPQTISDTLTCLQNSREAV